METQRTLILLTPNILPIYIYHIFYFMSLFVVINILKALEDFYTWRCPFVWTLVPGNSQNILCHKPNIFKDVAFGKSLYF